ncbi:hypothetical protein AGMMS49546_01400 [Spirochaetia bacterium]|nr:hypothetical protein FACS189479_02650 [Spirochaetia bacterium]GHV36313.1 hypothetical protein AGMMS49546_01370 [Spirochaetia bacterium]GHV36323.1 hypothetical protein AGMMS49546_01400 [Spirochaetia bacterium]
MATSKGRALGQAFIDSQKQYTGVTPTPAQVIAYVNSKLPANKQYTPSGAKNLIRWLKF